jgi:tryptophan synthase alpha chain
VFVSDFATMEAHGVLRFAVDAAGAGITGLLVPDLPAVDAANFKDACDSVGLDLIGFVGPAAGDEEIARAAATATGFVYCLASGGTVAGPEEPGDLDSLVERVRRHTDLPLAVGRGATTSETVARAARLAEGVFLGSELAGVIAAQPDDPIEIMLGVSDFIHEMKDATSRA